MVKWRLMASGTWSISAQVMVCCPTALFHYLNHCWPITREVLWPRTISHEMFRITYMVYVSNTKGSKPTPMYHLNHQRSYLVYLWNSFLDPSVFCTQQATHNQFYRYASFKLPATIQFKYVHIEIYMSTPFLPIKLGGMPNKGLNFSNYLF